MSVIQVEQDLVSLSAPRTALPRGLETERCPLSKSFLPSTIVTERRRVSSESDKTTLSPTAMP